MAFSSENYHPLCLLCEQKKVTLVAVTKMQSDEDVQALYNIGHRIFGENKVQEIVRKQSHFPKDVEWHMIGHLQSNKVSDIAPFVALIHSVDSLKILQEIDRQAKKNNRIISVLLQMHIAQEEHKYGFTEEELRLFFEQSKWREFENVNIKGLMGMATYTEDKNQIQNEFERIATFFNQTKTIMPSMDTLSIGMSGDYHLAIDSGSTMIRVGSLLFQD